MTVLLPDLRGVDTPGNTLRLDFRFMKGSELEWNEKTEFYGVMSPPMHFPLKAKNE